MNLNVGCQTYVVSLSILFVALLVTSRKKKLPNNIANTSSSLDSKMQHLTFY